MIILLMGYFISGYWLLLYYWILMLILLMGYYISDYWLLLY